MFIAISGANGFLGQHLVQTALDHGHKVLALVRKENYRNLFLPHSKLIIEVIDYSQSNQFFDSYLRKYGQIDVFLHNAGLTNSLRKEDFQKVNVELTEQVVQAIKKAHLLKKEGQFALVSSLAAIGPSNVGEPVSSYGRSKQEAERLIINSGMSYKIFRATGVYGPGDKAFKPLFLTSKMGVFFNLSIAGQRVSLIYAQDLAKKILTSFQGRSNAVYHLSDGESYSQKDLKTAFEKLFDRRIFVIRIPPFLVKVLLTISDHVAYLVGKLPPVTLEKYLEISQSWDHQELKKDPTLSENDTKIEEGFRLTLSAYSKS